ncbi:MAG TPA: phosphoserine phosphatase SerB [Stellaceae bacterium]|nr:phosphoserine phosphatase SerB [Stellaceae bacterium]
MTEANVRAVADALRAAGVPAAQPDWLDHAVACDIDVGRAPPQAVAAAIAPTIGSRPIDVAVVTKAHRRKKLLVADMDSTIIAVECIDELADFAGLKAKVAAITERAMQGEIDFKGALRERAAMLAGLDESVLGRVFRERVKLSPGATLLLATMRAHGAYAVLVSGGFTYFTSRVRAAAGFDDDQANTLEIANGKLTGRVVEPILDAGAKLAALERHRRQRNIGTDETLAVGDGANDLPMIQAAGLGVAYHAKPKVAAAAAIRIAHGDLTALLYLQGYRRGEFAA